MYVIEQSPRTPPGSVRPQEYFPGVGSRSRQQEVRPQEWPPLACRTPGHLPAGGAPLRRPRWGSPSTPACSGARLVPNVRRGGLHGPGGVNAVRPTSEQHLTYHNYTRSFQMLVILKLRATWGSAFETIRFMGPN